MMLFNDDELGVAGKPVERLKDRFMEVPTTVLNTQGGNWTERKRRWIKLGVKGHIGRNINGKTNGANKFIDFNMTDYAPSSFKTINNEVGYASVFNPALSELMYNWFCCNNGFILDPFAGGISRGAVAVYMGLHYTGIDLRKEQIDSNYELFSKMEGSDNLPRPNWVLADSLVYLDSIEDNSFDMMFTCPPYGDLEVYSDLQQDLSTMKLCKFNQVLSEILQKASIKIKDNGYIVIVAGDYRDKNGFLVDFLTTIKIAMKDTNYKLYNELILVTPIGTKAMTANSLMKNKKMVKCHENILIFKKNLIKNKNNTQQ
jgi:DNA modification methylase